MSKKEGYLLRGSIGFTCFGGSLRDFVKEVDVVSAYPSSDSRDSSDIAENHYYDVSSLYPSCFQKTPDTGDNKNSTPA